VKTVDVDIIVVISKMFYSNCFLFFVIYAQVLADFAYSAYFDIIDS